MKILQGAHAAPVVPEEKTVAGQSVRLFTCNTVVVGTGAAGYNAADTLHSLGQRDVMIVTEGVNMGTSRNTGSDKQTYYKLTMAGGASDSVEEMAETLFAGGSMHGDTALVEAAFSSRCFYKLVNVGVPFPHNRFGEYVGYKTDHDPRQRATSCGPLTSRFMTEKLEESVRARGIPVLDGLRVLDLVVADGGGATARAVGLLCLDVDSDPASPGLVLINCTNVVYAVGGPSGLYHASVYPESQTCGLGLAFDAGVPGVNLTESQYGIASLKFRWNLSGSYQQVIPAYISTDADGNDAREFLGDYFASPGAMLDAVFLKGYQWPFDPRKLGVGGSSLVDMAVYMECRKGRRVYMDFRKNPAVLAPGGAPDWSLVGPETRAYLENSTSTQATPIERLRAMNSPAYDLYRDNGIDLAVEPLEIAVCAQHNNGGLAVNLWWESALGHFFPVGEVAGTFGVYRPGGSALNSTQVGGARAAMFIRDNYGDAPMDEDAFLRLSSRLVELRSGIIRDLLGNVGSGETPVVLRERYQRMMDGCGAFLRPNADVARALGECRRNLAAFGKETAAVGMRDIVDAFINRDILIAQFVYLSAIAAYAAHGGGSRGSYLVCDSLADLGLEGGVPAGVAERGLAVPLDNGAHDGEVCEVRFAFGGEGEPACVCEWAPVRPMPRERGEWFEQVYNAWVRGEIVRR